MARGGRASPKAHAWPRDFARAESAVLALLRDDPAFRDAGRADCDKADLVVGLLLKSLTSRCRTPRSTLPNDALWFLANRQLGV